MLRTCYSQLRMVLLLKCLFINVVECSRELFCRLKPITFTATTLQCVPYLWKNIFFIEEPGTCTFIIWPSNLLLSLCIPLFLCYCCCLPAQRNVQWYNIQTSSLFIFVMFVNTTLLWLRTTVGWSLHINTMHTYIYLLGFKREPFWSRLRGLTVSTIFLLECIERYFEYDLLD